MAKKPDSRKGKDPARVTRAKAAREPLPPIAPALEKLLNPGIEKGTAGPGSQTGLKPPADNSFDRRADFAAAHKARASTPQGFREAPQKGYVAREPLGGNGLSAPSPTELGPARVPHHGAQVGQARLASGEGRGGGSELEAPRSPHRTTPTPDPSPQGGGELMGSDPLLADRPFGGDQDVTPGP